MIRGIVVACACGEVYELRPEYAGRLLECAVCSRHLRVGSPPRAGVGGGDPAFDRDAFLLRERLLTITSKYEVQGADATPILYVERPTYPFRTILAYLAGAVAASLSLVWMTAVVRSLRLDLGGALIVLAGLAPATFLVVSMSMRPLRHVTIYRNESRAEILLRVRQDQRWAVFTRTYTVMTAAGEILARLRKRYVHNIIRKRWYVEAPTGPVVALAIEESIVLSLLRRVLGSLFGLLRTNFVLVRPDGTVLGEFNRKFTILDRYVLDLSGDPERYLDRRVALALGIMLDTGEGR